jgi:transposase-like protein
VSKKVAPQQTEVVPKAKRRTFTAKYKHGILEEIAACKKPGEIGAILRREGLYSSLISDWRKAAKAQKLAALAPKKRGPKTTPPDPRDVELAKLRRQVAQLQARAEKAELIVEIQKKLSTILGVELPKIDEDH